MDLSLGILPGQEVLAMSIHILPSRSKFTYRVEAGHSPVDAAIANERPWSTICLRLLGSVRDKVSQSSQRSLGQR